jgi:SAM-dependent methyltransferase
MSEQTPRPDISFQIKNAARATAAMLAGMNLDLFTPLKDGPLRTEQLATELGVDAGKLGPLLYALVVAGLLTEQDGAFSNTPETDAFLVRGRAGYMGEAHKNWYSNLRASLQTPETVRTGVAQARYDWANMDRSELRTLCEGMAAGDVDFANWMSDRFDFSECHSLLDAGCGSGTFAIAMTQMHPHMTATVVDLPEVTPITEEFVLDAGASSRVQVVSADLTCDPIPGIHDAGMLSSVIQTLSAEDSRKVICNVGSAIKPGGWLYIVGGGMLKNSRLEPVSAVEWNLVFINTYDGGQSYTEDEFRDWLGRAGFEDLSFRYEDFTITARKSLD